MKKTLLMLTAVVVVATTSCTKNAIDPGIPELVVNEDAAAFAEIGSIDIGETGAAEISAYDAMTQKLFVVRNENEGLANQLNRIEVLDFSNPASPRVIANINVATLGGVVNSVSCFGGRVAAAIQATDKTANGKVAVFRTDDYFKVAEVTVGALPDMVTWSPDGRYILTANEGEPNDAYTVDPNGTISIIDALNNYTVTTLDFSAMASKQADLLAKGFRIFGPGKNFLKDIEPEYITVSGDSKTAWVTLQENNGIAKVDLVTKTITDIFPLGFKDYNANGNEIDPTDDNNAYVASKWKVFGVYMPDAIAVLEQGGTPYLFTANEGDAREYTGFTEIFRVKNNAVKLDPAAFPNATDLKKDGQLGRLNITTTLGDTDGDGDLDALYSFGARSFSLWNGLTGAQVFDSKNELDKVTSAVAGVYDDGRSDDKSVEPEGLAIGTMGSKKVAFVGMERADAVAIYDVTTPTAPKFLQLLKCGDAPEGVLFIPAKESPTRKSLLVVSSENDGIVKVYTPKNI